MSEPIGKGLLAQDTDEEELAGVQYLTFLLNGEQYGLNILSVQEIRGWEQVTRVPNSPHFVKGVVNIRGNIVPVFDLRRRFGLPEAEYTKETVIIVVRAGTSDEARLMGLVVDAVSDVLVVQEENISTTPEFGADVPTENIRGLVADGDHMVMLLDLESLVLLDDVTLESDAA